MLPKNPRTHLDEDIVRELQAAIGTPVRVQMHPVQIHPIEAWAQSARRQLPMSPPPTRPFRTALALVPWFLGAGLIVAGLLYVSQYGLRIKGRVIQQGSAAIAHLASAKENLEKFNFTAAQNDFVSAKERFDQASGETGILGQRFSQILGRVPGFHSLATGTTLISAGREIASAGVAMGEVVVLLEKSGGLLGGLAEVFAPLQKALEQAQQSTNRAAELLVRITPEMLPEDMRRQYVEFHEQLPALQKLLADGVSGVSFLSRFAGMDQPRRYLLLFQNSSELRPTGGFPGSYGLITFEGGRIKDIQADDIYNPDGQIHDLIVPPLQLQHITPSWGMRDANWFINFPTSAHKVMELYRHGKGAGVDGVITLRPDMISDLLRITGSISLPQYNVVLNADNFLPTVQLAVESTTHPEPKKIIMDLAPILLARISALPAGELVKVMAILAEQIRARGIMMYFNDSELEHYAVQKGWDGHVVETSGDYLMVNISNIKGAKADAVTDTSVKLEGQLDGGTMVHRLTLTRKHNGGDTPYGFYNKTNYSYVRVLVPKGSTLRGIVGNDHPANKPLMTYGNATAQYDNDLVALEKTYQYNAERDVTTYEESGKTGFGFWMKVAPGDTQEVQLEYVVPASVVARDYHLYIQRQSGLDLTNLEVTIDKSPGASVVSSTPLMVQWPDSWRLNDRLKTDLELSVQFK